MIAALGGLALGLTLLVRIDGASDILPVVPYCGMLLLGRRRQAIPLLGGLVAGALYGVVDGLVLTRPYLVQHQQLARAAGALAVLVGGRGGGGGAGARGAGALPKVRAKWLPNAVAVLAVVVLLGLAVRPYVQTVGRSSASGRVGARPARRRLAGPPSRCTGR